MRWDESEIAEMGVLVHSILEKEGTDTLTWLPATQRFVTHRQAGTQRQNFSYPLLPVMHPGKPVPEVVREVTNLRTGPWIGWCESWRDVGIQGWAHNVTMDVSGRGDGRPLPGARDRVSGKGRTHEESLTSAVGELCERRACTAPAPWVKKISGTKADLEQEGYDFIDFHDLEPFSTDQWADRDAINGMGHAHHKVSLKKPGSHTPLEWVEGRNLLDGSDVLVPLDYCYYKPGVPRTYFVPDSNGTAAGSSVEDATRRGLCELLERDAVSRWWYLKEEKQGILLDVDPMGARAEQEMAKRGRWIHLLDLTRKNSPCPVVVAVTGTWDTSTTGGEDIVPGFGCAPTYAEAARRAIGEAVQCCAFGMSVHQRMAVHNNDPDAWRGARWRRSTERWLRPHGYYLPTEKTPQKTAREISEGISTLTSGQVYVVELTSEGLPVVKTIAPGLRHWWPRWGDWSPNERTKVGMNPVINWL